MSTSDPTVLNGTIDISKLINKDFNGFQNYFINSGSEFRSDTFNFTSIEVEKNVRTLIRILKQDEFVPGELSKTQLFLENLLLKNVNLFKEVFQKTWVNIFPEKNTVHMINFISMASYFEYEALEDRADVLVLSGCAHSDFRVNEAAIIAIESWEQKKHIEFLKAIKNSEVNWLESYKSNVIRILESM